jgi:hypothetical protein
MVGGNFHTPHGLVRVGLTIDGSEKRCLESIVFFGRNFSCFLLALLQWIPATDEGYYAN